MLREKGLEEVQLQPVGKDMKSSLEHKLICLYLPGMNGVEEQLHVLHEMIARNFIPVASLCHNSYIYAVIPNSPHPLNEFLRQLPQKLVVASDQLQLLNTIGQG